MTLSEQLESHSCTLFPLDLVLYSSMARTTASRTSRMELWRRSHGVENSSIVSVFLRMSRAFSYADLAGSESLIGCTRSARSRLFVRPPSGHERRLTVAAGRRDTTQRTTRCWCTSSAHQAEGPATLARGPGEGKARRGHDPDELSEPLQQETILNVFLLDLWLDKSFQHEESGYRGVELSRRQPLSALGAHLTCIATAGGPRQPSISCNKPRYHTKAVE